MIYKRTFADDSASQEDSPINREDLPVSDLLGMEEMNRELEEFLEQDDVAQMLDDFVMTQAEVETDGNGLTQDFGLSNLMLLTFFRNFKSAKKYKAEIVKFCLFVQAQEDSSEENMINNMTVDDGASAEGLLDIKKKASTTLRGIFSVLKKMWQYTQRGCLAAKAPLVTDLLDAWDKEHRTKQSAVFTREHIIQLLQMPDCPKVLLNKTYAVVSLTLAGRGIEAYNTVVGDVTRVEDGAGNVSYQVAFDRVKQHTTTSSDRHMAVINGQLEVRTLDAFIATRPAGPVGEVEKTKKFFRQISSTAGGKLKTSWAAQNVGKASLANIGREVAKMLEISYWLQFTGHCWRRTAITFGPNAGMSLPQLKAMSGHHSDSVVQGYIDKGMPMKLLAAGATLVSGGVFGKGPSVPGFQHHLQTILRKFLTKSLMWR
ncbi:hypothetical protein B484DRAFT_399427 [Ochromonadaceae sp. CCMP2298]|nr:hypothetical protein B484DRAFT_399427 [Ochromonadaceae sp. CCMP2298]